MHSFGALTIFATTMEHNGASRLVPVSIGSLVLKNGRAKGLRYAASWGSWGQNARHSLFFKSAPWGWKPFKNQRILAQMPKFPRAGGPINSKIHSSMTRRAYSSILDAR